MTKIGIIGTGMLGEAVGLHLLDSKYEVTVYNRTKDKVENLVKHGAVAVESPKDCLLYTSPSPRDGLLSRMPSSA